MEPRVLRRVRINPKHITADQQKDFGQLLRVLREKNKNYFDPSEPAIEIGDMTVELVDFAIYLKSSKPWKIDEEEQEEFGIDVVYSLKQIQDYKTSKDPNHPNKAEIERRLVANHQGGFVCKSDGELLKVNGNYNFAAYELHNKTPRLLKFQYTSEGDIDDEEKLKNRAAVSHLSTKQTVVINDTQLFPSVISTTLLKQMPGQSLDKVIEKEWKEKKLEITSLKARKKLSHEIFQKLHTQFHARGRLHLDVKESNTTYAFIDGKPVINYIDDESMQRVDKVDPLKLAGTVPYRAPEVKSKKVRQENTVGMDYYAFGIMLLRIWGCVPEGLPKSQAEPALVTDITNTFNDDWQLGLFGGKDNLFLQGKDGVKREQAIKDLKAILVVIKTLLSKDPKKRPGPQDLDLFAFQVMRDDYGIQDKNNLHWLTYKKAQEVLFQLNDFVSYQQKGIAINRIIQKAIADITQDARFSKTLEKDLVKIFIDTVQVKAFANLTSFADIIQTTQSILDKTNENYNGLRKKNQLFKNVLFDMQTANADMPGIDLKNVIKCQNKILDKYHYSMPNLDTYQEVNNLVDEHQAFNFPSDASSRKTFYPAQKITLTENDVKLELKKVKGFLRTRDHKEIPLEVIEAIENYLTNRIKRFAPLKELKKFITTTFFSNPSEEKKKRTEIHLERLNDISNLLQIIKLNKNQNTLQFELENYLCRMKTGWDLKSMLRNDIRDIFELKPQRCLATKK